MRVAIDVTTALTQRAGVGRYTRDLVRALAYLPDGPDLRPFYVAPDALYELGAGLQVAALRRPIRWWRLAMLLQHAARRTVQGPWSGADVYHAPDVVFPYIGAQPVVSTVHDLSYVVYPRYHTRLNGAYLRLLTPLMAQRARLVIAVSEATRRDLVERLGVPEGKIRVVYSGVSEVFTRPPAAQAIDDARRRYGLDGDFILSVGTLEPRKNLAGTLAAYRRLRERQANVPPLALAGAAGWGLHEEELLGPASRTQVQRLGFVPDADLAALYAACSAFVYPSFYEGWGLPVAEALSMGAPTITSNVSSLPEVAGDAAYLVDPGDCEQIASALEEVLGDEAVAGRLRSAGPPQARRFTTQAWAAATARVYDEARAG
jgi:glycosyltransferase involved in cell wall biosynthesis